MRVRRSLRATLLFFVLIPSTVLAWGPLAHDAIGREAVGNSGLAIYHNLPDSWPYWNLAPEVISEWFAWTHGVQRTGTSGPLDRVPNVPVYALENPGESMLQLCENACTELQQATILGFLAHGVEDHAVHWTFSPGGTVARWYEHRMKEKWADCIVYRSILKRGFAVNGAADNLPQIRNGGDASLIRLAEQRFNQRVNANTNTNNQYSVDQGKPTPLSRIELLPEIEAEIAAYERNIREQLLDNVNLRNCASLDTTANQRRMSGDSSWSVSEVERYYRSAVDSVKLVYDQHKF
jgi:hypothetical protein